MDKNNYLRRIAELTAQIHELPKGYISKKIVGGKVYFYHQWSENGNKQSRYLHDNELVILSEQIDRRRQLQEAYKELKAEMTGISEDEDRESLRCTLMHKKIPVVELDLDRDSGFIRKVGVLHTPEHLPVGVNVRNGVADRKSLNDWWIARSIPASRSGIREALDTLGITNTRTLLVRCYGLSLSDQYWICPIGSALTWEDINFFTNPFSDDIGNVLFGSEQKTNPLNFSSPDNTSDGSLKKRWKIIDGRRCLAKGGSNPYRQQPFNEVIAAEIMKRLGIDCVPYTVSWNKGAPYSICEDFVDENTELVPAWRIVQTRKQPNNMSLYHHFVACAESLGIPGVVPFLDRMIVLDYIIANEDRHMNNFGALRNAETLEWLGMAPMYDSGSSLGYDKIIPLMNKREEIVCKPFKNHHDEQLALVSSFEWIDFSALSDVREVITGIFSDENARDYVDEKRIRAIADLTEQRIRRLAEVARNRKST